MPMLVITGSRDPGRKGEAVDWRIEPFNYALPGDKYLLFIQNADHSFGGLTDEAPGYPLVGMQLHPEISAHVDYVNSVTTVFWDTYLLGDKAARDYLNSATSGHAKITTK
jgi:hypothetical protein